MRIDRYALKHIERLDGCQVSVAVSSRHEVVLIIESGSKSFQIPFTAEAAQQLGGHIAIAASEAMRLIEPIHG